MPDEPPKPSKEPEPKPEKEVEIKTTFIEVFGDRFKSHTLGGFALAWVAIHWKAIYATAFVNLEDLRNGGNSTNAINTKLDYIKYLGYDWCDNLWLPLTIALVVPIVAHLFDETLIKLLKRMASNWGVELRAEHAKETVFSQEQMNDAVTKATSFEKKFEAEKKLRESAEDQVDNLRGRIKQLAHAHGIEVVDLEKTIADTANELASARDGVQDLQRQLSEKESQLTDLGRRYDDQKNELSEANKLAQVAASELDQLENFKQQREALLRLMSSTVAPLVDEIRKGNGRYQGHPFSDPLRAFDELEKILTSKFLKTKK